MTLPEGASLPSEADAVVIGAGAFGSSIAYHLARLGWRKTVLLDRHELASQTSPRAAGLSAQLRGTDLMTRLARRGVQLIRRFAADTGEALVSTQPGSVKIARTPDHEAQLRAEVERGRRLGIDVDLISPAEVPRLAPFVEPGGIRAATYVTGDVYLEPMHLWGCISPAEGRAISGTYGIIPGSCSSTCSSWWRSLRRPPSPPRSGAGEPPPAAAADGRDAPHPEAAAAPRA
jgi:glycine/D-amino acid oxidase-like deaminating enzyme